MHFYEVAQGWTFRLRRLSVWRRDRHLMRLVDVSVRMSDCELIRPCSDLAKKAIATNTRGRLPQGRGNFSRGGLQ